MSLAPLEQPRLGEEESLFSRDLDGRLVRLDKATAEQLAQDVTIAIDDRAIRVKRAVAAVDPQGNPRLDADGRVIPRPTTIYDAAQALADAVPVAGPGGGPLQDAGGRTVFRPRTPDDPRPLGGPRAENPIPVLCHQPHLDPVAVCRACVVEISRIKRGERRTERKLLPACQHRVEEAMEVRTIATSDKVRAAVKTVVELLAADHPSPCSKERERPGECELEALAGRLELDTPRFAGRPARPKDDSSLLIAVDHSACILCDRCIRGCNEVKDNQVLGRMFKGYEARIAFDLDAPMGNSSCVSCGECMVSCPTGALTFRAAVDATAFEGLDPPAEPVAPRDLYEHPDPEIRGAFADVSPTFLGFNAGSVVRRRFAPGAVVCWQGEYGATAFFLEGGSVDVFIRNARSGGPRERPGGFFGWLRRGKAPEAEDTTGRDFILADTSLALRKERPAATLGTGELVGEMACINGYPRSATVTAGAEGCTMLELQRNVLDILRRSRTYRERMDRKYRERVVRVALANIPVFAGLDEPLMDELGRRARYRRCEPGETILRQGEPAVDPRNPPAEGMFLVRSGFVRIERTGRGGVASLNYVGPGAHFGEIALLSGFAGDELGATASELGADMDEIRRLAEPGRRTATCTTLDHVELVQIAPEDFGEILRRASPEARRSIVSLALGRLRETMAEGRPGESAREATGLATPGPLLREFLDQGLMGAQSVLVLDLVRCTRCDECSKACSDTHGGVTRLIREGLRFDRFLVASSCRSCHDPVCLVGCPVDAIHRRPGSAEIRIEDTCIGCGRCAENCPYGNINMHVLSPPGPPAAAEARVAVARRATTCDQCHSLPGHLPNCVVACPHDAAHRMDGPELFRLVRQATA